jgi:hypothetical protein
MGLVQEKGGAITIDLLKTVLNEFAKAGLGLMKP